MVGNMVPTACVSELLWSWQLESSQFKDIFVYICSMSWKLHGTTTADNSRWLLHFYFAEGGGLWHQWQRKDEWWTMKPTCLPLLEIRMKLHLELGKCWDHFSMFEVYMCLLGVFKHKPAAWHRFAMTLQRLLLWTDVWTNLYTNTKKDTSWSYLQVV